MPKGFFTASAIVLCKEAPALEALHAALERFSIMRRVPAEAQRGWMAGNPGAVLAMRPEANGYVIVEVVEEPWPDGMGDPKEDGDLFGAWGMGFFGPFVFPGNLARAEAMPHFFGDASPAIAAHRAFVRVLVTWVLGADEEAPMLPPDYDPVAELSFVTEVARALLELPGALCYFNPNGETLLPAAALAEVLEHCQSRDVVPLPVWSNVRLFDLDEGSGWSAMDTIGMAQLDVADNEACFARDAYDTAEIEGFLRNATDFARRHPGAIGDGFTIDGPGGVKWRARLSEQSLAPAPRAVVRWVPEDGRDPPARITERP